MISIIARHSVQKAAPVRRYLDVGRCIYCFCAPPEATLTDEHIIADGLRGDLVLPKSSCSECAKITGRIEQLVLRQMLEQPRAALGMHSRKRRSRKKGIHMRVAVDGNPEVEREVSQVGMPPFLITFVGDDLPGILTGASQNREWAGRVMLVLPENATEQARKVFGNGSFKFGFRFHAGVFSQAVAKTAYAYAVAELGLNSFKPFLANYCIADEPPFDSYHIASFTDPHSDTALHSIVVGDAYAPSLTVAGIMMMQVVVVQFRMFAELGGPTFVVVVGRR